MADRAVARSDSGRGHAGPEQRRECADPTPPVADDDGATRTIDPIDREIGGRVRVRRVALGLSQKRLAALLGVRFQQVQKYENGANRIAASRLLDISDALLTPIEHFYADLPTARGPAAESDLIDRIQAIAAAPDLLARFGSIPDAGVRRKLLSLAKEIAGDEAEGRPSVRDDREGSGVGKGLGAP